MQDSSTTHPASRRDGAVAFFLPVVLLLPFINRAYNIDEPMFIMVAQQITREPLDFFGSSIDVGGSPLPMYLNNQNPPGFSYLLAIAGAIGGWSEPVLHIVSLLAAGACGLGIYHLAARFCARPLLASVLAVLTPGFFVSAMTVMTDVAMTACYVWAAVAWLHWMDSARRAPLVAAAALIAAGALLKYYAITLVPLLGVYTLLKGRRPGAWVFALAAPGAVLGLFFVYGRWKYGVNLLEAAANTAQHPSIRAGITPWFRPIVTVLFLGGCFAPLALVALRAIRPFVLFLGLAGIAFLLGLRFHGFTPLQLLLGTTKAFDMPMLVHVGVMFAAGLLMLAILLRDAWQQRDADTTLLGLWILGALAFTIYVNHLINARVVLPAVPALAILAVRALPPVAGPLWRIAPVLAGGVLSMWVAWGDYAVAEGSRHTARESGLRAKEEKVDLFYAGTWGFQYYLMERGAKPFSVIDGGWGGEHIVRMPHRALLAVSSDGHLKWKSSPNMIEELAVYSVPNRAGVVTYYPGVDAGFYSHLLGIVPYNFAVRQPEEFGLYRWNGRSYRPEEATP